MNTTSLSLARLFMERRQELRRRLKYRLGSEELANDALQETYLRIERMGDADSVSSNPVGYLFRMAVNAAADQRQADSRYLTGSEVEELLNTGADSLDPARVIHARFEVQALTDALGELTARQRAILIAAQNRRYPAARDRRSLRDFGTHGRQGTQEGARALRAASRPEICTTVRSRCRKGVLEVCGCRSHSPSPCRAAQGSAALAAALDVGHGDRIRRARVQVVVCAESGACTGVR
jgi:DNA-directed RNA polymerase specialized sigma24 family protein